MGKRTVAETAVAESAADAITLDLVEIAAAVSAKSNFVQGASP